MPFETTPNLPGDPLVTVKFSGLFVLQPGADNTCDVGVHKLTDTHVFQVMLITSKQNEAPTLIPLFTGDLQAQFFIRLGSNPSTGDFKVFEKEPFNHTSQGSNRKDARWAVNLQSADGDIRVNEGAMPFVTLKTGVLFTPSLSNPLFKPKFKRPPATTAMEMESVAPELAVAIHPPPNTGVVLEWTEDKKQIVRRLPRDNDPSARYTVYFLNEPPTVNVKEHDELDLYYQILHRNGAPVPEAERCTLVFEIPRTDRLDQIPCNPVTLNP